MSKGFIVIPALWLAIVVTGAGCSSQEAANTPVPETSQIPPQPQPTPTAPQPTQPSTLAVTPQITVEDQKLTVSLDGKIGSVVVKEAMAAEDG